MNSRDLEWEHRTTGYLLRLAAPIAVSMVSYAVMTLVDTLFVARIGPSALAGVGLGGTLAFVVMAFGFGLLRAVKIAVSQARGAGRTDTGTYVDAGLVTALALGVAITAITWTLAPWLRDLVVDPAAGAVAVDYLRARIFGAPVTLVFVVLRESRYGHGDSRSPAVASVLANAANIGLDAWFILGLNMGPVGAAWATNAAQLLQAGLLLSVTWQTGWRPARPRLRALSYVLRLGLPTGLHFTLESSSFAALTAILARLPPVELAAHQVALQVLHFSFLPGVAVGEAASVLVGEAVGAGRDRLVRPVARRALAVAGAYALLCTAVLVLWREPLARAFSDDPELVSATTTLLLIAAVFQIFDAANIVGRGVLRGTGDVRVPAVVGVASAWLLTPPLAWGLGIHLGWGAVGGWIGLCLEICGVAAFYLWRVEREGWRASAVRSREAITRENAENDAEVAARAAA